MTRAEILTAIRYELGKNTSTLDTLTTNRLLASLNQRHRRYLSAPGLQHLRDDTIALASVASQALYGIPNVAKVNRMRDLTHDQSLGAMTLDEYRRVEPDPAENTGIPSMWVWKGYGATAKPPANASELFVKSTSVSDTSTAYLDVRLADGSTRTLSVVLTGTTAVSVSTAVVTILEVSKCYLSLPAVGTVTVHEDSGVGTELARIGPGATRTRYYQFYLWQTPSLTNASYELDITRELTDLAQDTDEPMLPADFHDLLVLAGVADEYRHTDDSRYGVVMSELRAREGQFRYWMHETASGSEMPRGPVSRLGPWFPAGS